MGNLVSIRASAALVSDFENSTTDPKNNLVRDWGRDEVHYFLDLIPLRINNEPLTTVLRKYRKQFENTTGSTLLELCKDDTKFASAIPDVEHRLLISCVVKELEIFNGGILNKKSFTVMSKLLSTNPDSSKNMQARYRALENIDKNTNERELLKKIRDDLLSSERYYNFAQLATVQSSQDSVFAHEMVLQKADDIEDEEFLAIKKFYSLNDKKGFRVKVILTPIFSTDGLLEKLKAKTIHPLVGGLLRDKLYTPFASFHACLLVGPYLMEFNNSGLVIPRRFQRKNAVFMLDVLPPICYETEEEHSVLLKSIEKSIFTVAEKYNTEISYYNMPGLSSGTANCQMFVDDLLAQIMSDFGISPDKNLLNNDGCIKRYLSYIRNDPDPKMKFFVSNDFRNRLKGKMALSDKVFQTHEELDDFIQKIIKAMGGPHSFQEKHPAEFFLLKSFDRIFWTQFLFSTPQQFEEDAKAKNVSAHKLLEEYRKKPQPKGFHFLLDKLDLSSDLTYFCMHDTQSRIYSHNCPFEDPRTMTLRC